MKTLQVHQQYLAPFLMREISTTAWQDTKHTKLPPTRGGTTTTKLLPHIFLGLAAPSQGGSCRKFYIFPLRPIGKKI